MEWAWLVVCHTDGLLLPSINFGWIHRESLKQITPLSLVRNFIKHLEAENLWFLQKAFFFMVKTPLNAEKFLKKIGLGKEDHYFWKQIGKALLCTYTLFGVAWWWNETSPLGWMTLKPKPKEEKEMAYLYERRRFPYPGDKEATDEFIASGGTIGTTIGPKGIIESGEDPDNFQKKLRSKKLEQESLKLWLRMRNEVISDLQEKGYDVE